MVINYRVVREGRTNPETEIDRFGVMSEKTHRIRVEFGPFGIVLEGFDSSSDGAEMAAQLIRKLSVFDTGSVPIHPTPAPGRKPHIRPGQPRPKPERPLRLPEDARTGLAPTGPAEFHSTRPNGAAEPDKDANGSGSRHKWQAYIDQLEETTRQAVTALTDGHDDAGMPQDRAPDTPQASPAPDGAEDIAQIDAAMPVADDGGMPGAAPDGPEADADGFSPRRVANADIHPPEAAPRGEDTQSIRQNMDINRRAIEQAAGETAALDHPDGIDHDYLAMEDKAIDRLLETTNALLEADDHTRKNQSLDRLKAAVAATEAERRISVKTATGTVTLDFDKKDSTRHPVTDLLTTPKIDPEKRKQRLQDYRKMISENKKRP